MRKNPKNPKEKKHPRIRRRVFAYLAAFVAFVLALLWLMQIVWLDDFYRWDKTRQITQAADAVESNIGNEQLSALIDRLAQQNDVCILLLDSDKHVFLSSDDIHYCLIHRMSSRDLSFWCSMIPENGDTLTELFNIAPFGGDHYNSHQFRGNVPKMEDDKKQSLLCARRVTLPDGTGGYLLLNSIITPLDSTVATLRTQLMLITIIVLLGATLLAMLISRKVTRSIVETSEAAHSLSRGQYEIPPHGCEYREMAELNDTLVYAAKELSQVENLQHELIANISHDLRTPLTAINGWAETLAADPGANPEQTQRGLNIIVKESRRLTTMVEELLDFTRMQDGRFTLRVEETDLLAELEDAIFTYREIFSREGIELRYECADDLPPIIADGERMKQVFCNVLDNAAKHGGSGKRIDVSVAAENGSMVIRVRDFGPGIPVEELPYVKQKFYKGSSKARGSGIGLAVCDEIMRLHNGTFDIANASGGGAVVTMTLPMEK